MLARTPITRVDPIRTPLLVIQGANDVRVVQAESDNLVDELRASGVEVEYMIKHDEGHGFVNQENVIDMYHVVERFLAEHLGDEVSHVRPTRGTRGELWAVLAGRRPARCALRRVVRPTDHPTRQRQLRLRRT
jgi:acetyl esterase/lipase